MPIDRFRALALSCLALAVLGLTPAALADHDEGITLYADAGFRGTQETFVADVPSLANTRFGNDCASSVRVPPGCSVVLYDDAGYRGRSTRLTADTGDLERYEIGNDHASSLKVDCRRAPAGDVDWDFRRGVALYADADFGGRREIFYGDDSDLRNNRIGSRDASSLRVAPGCQVTLYTEPGYRGRADTFSIDVFRLANTRVGNDSAASLRIECDRGREQPYGAPEPWAGSRGAVVYTDADFRGRSQTFYDEVENLGFTEIGNDSASSARVAPGCRLVLFEHDRFGGRSSVVTGDVRSFRDTSLGDDRASSLRVECGRGHRRAGDRQPGYGEPGYGQPGYGQPGYQDPGDRGGVTLYDDEDFRGRDETFYGNARDLAGSRIGNDSASSVRVAPGCRAVLYRDRDFRGQSAVVSGDVSSLKFTGVGNDSVSSIEVDCGR